MRKHIRSLVAYAESLGATNVKAVHAGTRHPKLIGNIKGRGFKIGVTGTPSDCRSESNDCRDIRHAILRAAGYDIPFRHHKHA